VAGKYLSTGVDLFLMASATSDMGDGTMAHAPHDPVCWGFRYPVWIHSFSVHLV